MVISQVVAGSPAAQAGLRQADEVTKIDGQLLSDESTLGRVLSGRKPGDQVTLAVRRNGQTLELKITLGTRPAGR